MPRHPDDEQLRAMPWWLVIAGLASAAAIHDWPHGCVTEPHDQDR